jgi:hypothetical protein
MEQGAAHRRGVPINELERKQLDALRDELNDINSAPPGLADLPGFGVATNAVNE